MTHKHGLNPMSVLVFSRKVYPFNIMITLSNGNILGVTGPLCGEFTGHKGQWREALMFSLVCVWLNGWVNNREAGDLRRYRSHYSVIVMSFLCIGQDRKLKFFHRKVTLLCITTTVTFLLNSLSRPTTNKTSKFRITGFFVWRIPWWLPLHRASNSENIAMLWRNHRDTNHQRLWKSREPDIVQPYSFAIHSTLEQRQPNPWQPWNQIIGYSNYRPFVCN